MTEGIAEEISRSIAPVSLRTVPIDAENSKLDAAAFQVKAVTDPAGLEGIFKLRYLVFTEEQGKHVGLADHDRQQLSDELDAHSKHFQVSHNGVVVGGMRIVYGADHISSEMRENLGIDHFLTKVSSKEIVFSSRLFILKEFRSTPALFKLFDFCYRSARENGAKFDIIYCKPNLVRLYEHLGYRRYRAYFDHPSLGLEVPMALATEDLVFLKAISSPLALSARHFPCDGKLNHWFENTFPDCKEIISPVTLGSHSFLELISKKINDSVPTVFRDLSTEEERDLLTLTTHLSVKAGTRVIRRGDPGAELYLIIDGVAEVTVDREGLSPLLLSTFGPGDTFGEMALLSNTKRLADVTAKGPLEVVLFDDQTIKRLMNKRPSIVAKLLYNLARVLALRFELSSIELATATMNGTS